MSETPEREGKEMKHSALRIIRACIFPTYDPPPYELPNQSQFRATIVYTFRLGNMCFQESLAFRLLRVPMNEGE